ncbi:MAG TPA: carboxymuconolactone decarboxylase family protein [Candidatus Dormibacteraeota bacterium]
MDAYLSPVERPRGLVMRLIYFFSKRFLGKVPTPVTVYAARMPLAFLTFSTKIARLDRKLKLPASTVALVRAQVTSVNSCLFCEDVQRWYVMKKSPETLAQLDALPEYRASSLFNAADRAALDYATELTSTKSVRPETFARLAEHFGDREICEIVWCVASEHLYNISNHGLGIGSDGFCELRPPATAATEERGDAREAVAAR